MICRAAGIKASDFSPPDICILQQGKNFFCDKVTVVTKKPEKPPLLQQFLQPGVFPQRAEAPGFAERTAHAFVIAFGEETGLRVIEGGRFRCFREREVRHTVFRTPLLQRYSLSYPTEWYQIHFL